MLFLAGNYLEVRGGEVEGLVFPVSLVLPVVQRGSDRGRQGVYETQSRYVCQVRLEVSKIYGVSILKIVKSVYRFRNICHFIASNQSTLSEYGCFGDNFENTK